MCWKLGPQHDGVELAQSLRDEALGSCGSCGLGSRFKHGLMLPLESGWGLVEDGQFP